MQIRDLPAVAALHERALEHGLFPQLGRSFLRRYLATFVDSPHCTAAVAVDGVDGRTVVGFVVATLAPAAHAGWVRRRALAELLLSGTLALLARPRLLGPFLTTRLSWYATGMWRRLRGPRRVVRRRPAVLHHVAVAPAARGRGVGAALTEHVVTTAARSGAAEVRLITPADGRAEAFYDRMGWERLERRRARDGSPVTEYRRRTGAA